MASLGCELKPNLLGGRVGQLLAGAFQGHIRYLHQWNGRVLVLLLQFREVSCRGRPIKKVLPSLHAQPDTRHLRKGGPSNYNPSPAA